MFVDIQAPPFVLCSFFVFRVMFGFTEVSWIAAPLIDFFSQHLLNMERTWSCICYLLCSVICIVDHEKLIAIKRNILGTFLQTSLANQIFVDDFG